MMLASKVSGQFQTLRGRRMRVPMLYSVVIRACTLGATVLVRLSFREESVIGRRKKRGLKGIETKTKKSKGLVLNILRCDKFELISTSKPTPSSCSHNLKLYVPMISIYLTVTRL